MNVHKIVWREGMLLRPAAPATQRPLLRQATRCEGGPSCWAASLGLPLDWTASSYGQAVISRPSGVLPDGSLFELGGNTEPLALDVPPNTSNVPIYLLALPLVTGNPHRGAPAGRPRSWRALYRL
ncbi:type VI secretion system baseplate subunit TssK [Pseudomonas aeruginosa]